MSEQQDTDQKVESNITNLAQSFRPRSDSVKSKLNLTPPEREKQPRLAMIDSADFLLALQQKLDPLRADISLLTSSLSEISKKVENVENNVQDGFDKARIKEAISEVFSEGIIDSLKDEIKSDIRAQLKDEIVTQVKNEIRDELKAELLDEVKKEFKDQLRTELKDEFKTNFEQQWSNTLVDEIRRHDTGLIIKSEVWSNGYNPHSFIAFCTNCLKLDPNKTNSMFVKSVSTLGKPRAGPNPRVSVLVILGSVSDRNDCLSASYNLNKDISIDKYVPKRFENKYNEFKEVAWKIRTSQNLNTWVGFEDHRLVIKQKKKNDGPGRV